MRAKSSSHTLKLYIVLLRASNMLAVVRRGLLSVFTQVITGRSGEGPVPE